LRGYVEKKVKLRNGKFLLRLRKGYSNRGGN